MLATQPFHMCQDPAGRVGRVQGTGAPREGCSVGSRPPLICALVLGRFS